jgi:hypothetical protein
VVNVLHDSFFAQPIGDPFSNAIFEDRISRAEPIGSFELVTVASARGPIRRTVIAEIGDVIVLADPSRAEEAKMAGITRFSIGFRRSDVISVEGLDKLVRRLRSGAEGVMYIKSLRN